MNLCRRISMASGSFNLWKMVVAPASSGFQNYHIWKVARTTVAAPFSSRVGISSSEAAPPIKADICGDGASNSAEKSKAKVQIYQKLRNLTVETIDLIINDAEKKGVFVTQEDLVRWAKLLNNKNNNPENALEIFRWMESKKMKFSPEEHELYVDLIARVEGYGGIMKNSRRAKLLVFRRKMLKPYDPSIHPYNN